MARQLATALEVDESGDNNGRFARPSGGGMLRDDKDAAILRAVAAKREPRGEAPAWYSTGVRCGDGSQLCGPRTENHAP